MSWGSSSKTPVPPPTGRAVDMEEQLILRVPQQVADQVRKMLRAKQFNEDIEFKFAEDGRNVDFKVGNRKFDAYLLDLPCIIESHKTLDKTTYYKSADIGQMLLVPDPNKDFQVPQDYKLAGGLNPPTKDIRRRKWRKGVDRDKMMEIENEVLRLLKPSENETIEVINPEDCTEEELNGIVETVSTISNEIHKPDTKNTAKDTPAPKEKRPPKKKKKVGEAVPDKIEKSEEAEVKSEQPADKKKPKAKKERVKKEKVKKAATDKDGAPEKEKKHRRKRQKADTETPSGATATTTTTTTVPVTQPNPAPPMVQASSLPASMPFPFAVAPTPAVISPPTRVVNSPPLPEVAPIPPPINTQQSLPIPAFAPSPAPTSIPIPMHMPISAPVHMPVPTMPTFAPAQVVPQPIKPLAQEAPTQPVVSAENAALLVQHKKLGAEVASMRANVAAAEANVKKAPNPVIKGRASAKLAEANEALKAKLDELAATEASLAEYRR